LTRAQGSPKPRAVKTVFQLVMAAIALVVVALVTIGFAFPSHWRAERSLLMNADPAIIHSVVSDLRTWPEWADAPLLANANFTYSGPERGAGATRTWRDARGVEGKMEITRDDPSGVWFRSDVNQGSTISSGSIVYEPSAAGTNVIWRDEGDLPRPFGLYFRDGVERDVRTLFDRGLLRLKRLAEERARNSANAQVQ
jgi:hypothetical protein